MGWLQLARDLAIREILFKSEMEATKMDNSRLLRLLISTDEYKTFSRHCNETERAHYIRPPSLEMYNNQGQGQLGMLQASKPMAWDQLEKLAGIYPMDQELVENTDREVLSWVPCKAMWVMKEFWIKSCPHIPSHVINQLILDVNGVWQKKEDRRVSNLRHR